MSPLRNSIFQDAARHHGVISRTRLTELGCNRHRLRALVRDGTLAAIGAEAFRVGGAPRTALHRVAAACLDTGGVASHQTAAWLHGLPGFTPGDPPHIMVRRRSTDYRGTAAQVHCTTWLPRDDFLVVRGIPCLSVARGLFALAAPSSDLPTARLRSAVDDAVRLGKASDPWLWSRLEELRCRGRGGVARFEAVLQHRSGVGATESWLERELLRLIGEAGLPLPACQRRIGRRGSFVARVDFSYDDERIVIEALGHTVHCSPAQLAADAGRRNHLQLAGYQVLEFTYDDIVARPERVVATISAALAASRSA